MNRPIGSRLLSPLIFAFILVLMLISGLNTWRQLQYYRKTAISEAVHRNSNLAVALEQYTIRTIQSADAILWLAKLECEKKEENGDFQKLVTLVPGNKDLFEGMAIMNEKGLLTFTGIRSLKDTVIDFSDRLYFQYHATHKNNELYVSKPLLSRTINQTVIVLSRRINKPNGEFDGVVALQILPSTLTSFYSNAELRPHELMSLVAPDGITYARRTGQTLSSGEDIHKSPLFDYLKTQSSGTYFASDAIRGIPTFFSFRKLQGLPFIATVGKEESDVLSGYERYKDQQVIQLILLWLLLAVFAVLLYIGLRYRRRSLQQLKESESRYRLMFANSKDAIILLDAAENLLDLNTAALRLLKVGEGRPLNFRTFVPDGLSALEGQDDSPTDYDSREFLVSREDGSSFTAEISCSSYTSAQNQKMSVVLIRDTTEKKKLQQRILNEKKKKHRQITKQVILAQEREREIIGRELHDNVKQILASVKLYLEYAVKEPAMVEQLLPKSIELINISIKEIRDLSHALTAPTLGSQSLVDAINALVANFQTIGTFDIRFCFQHYEEQIEMDQKLALYRIVQEQMDNIVKHANASCVAIALRQENNHTILLIEDDGKGFDTTKERSGVGLNNIESRVKVFSGSICIQSKPGSGCRMTVALPLRKKPVIAPRETV